MNLPSGFQPFIDLAICGNRFIRGIAPFAIGDQPILLIGKGDIPSVWLVAPSSPSNTEFLTFVANNESQHPEVNVQVFEQTRSVQVSFRGTTLISVKKILDDMAAVEQIDLRPLGLNICGSEVSLNVSGITLVGNRTEGASVLFGLG
jgi:hypothetical protein